jgi:hypothetical protein
MEGAVVSIDHAGESECVQHLAAAPGPALGPAAAGSRTIAPEQVRQHNGEGGSGFWAVIDGFVVDVSGFLGSHPGGLPKLMSADAASTGATGKEFGFSFSRGRNAHFPDTGRRFAAGVQRFLAGGSAEVAFPPHGKLVILGRLQLD